MSLSHLKPSMARAKFYSPRSPHSNTLLLAFPNLWKQPLQARNQEASSLLLCMPTTVYQQLLSALPQNTPRTPATLIHTVTSSPHALPAGSSLFLELPPPPPVLTHITGQQALPLRWPHITQVSVKGFQGPQGPSRMDFPIAGHSNVTKHARACPLC